MRSPFVSTMNQIMKDLSFDRKIELKFAKSAPWQDSSKDLFE